MDSYKRYDVVLESGSGEQAVDENGKQYSTSEAA
jgi:acetylornithine/succinyldiaminopimelate/putrescine aminotransferase